MTFRSAHWLPLALLAAGCGLSDGEGGAQLLVPEDVDVQWDDAFNAAEDGLSAVIPVDLLVFDRATGDALGDQWLEIEARGGEVDLLLPHQLDFAVDTSCLDCGNGWDARGDRYFSVLAEESARTLGVGTDQDGSVRLYVVVDSFSVDAGVGFDPVSVVVSAGTAEEGFVLAPF